MGKIWGSEMQLWHHINCRVKVGNPRAIYCNPKPNTNPNHNLTNCVIHLTALSCLHFCLTFTHFYTRMSAFYQMPTELWLLRQYRYHLQFDKYYSI